jgi:2-polyprenyl-3-methyl-5-hydroxy-6-metoxy-1,4-benzoquinol methylase
MMNRLHARLHRPENGWDPVPSRYAVEYAGTEWLSGVNESLLDTLDDWVGGLNGKSVLDLGGGGGQYSVAFAVRGAAVTWHDVSATYLEFAKGKVAEHGVDVDFSLGYMDEAPQRFGAQFDLVFNRICWYYGWTDASFASVIFALVKPGGVGYVDCMHSGWQRDTLSTAARFRTWLNDALSFKVGHPFPPHGRIARLFAAFPIEKMLIDYGDMTNDRILFKRAGSG